MDIKDQIAAILGLVVIVIIAGLLFVDIGDQGQVAGIDTGQEESEIFSKVQSQSENVSDIGQKVVDQSIGAEIKAIKEAKEAIENK